MCPRLETVFQVTKRGCSFWAGGEEVKRRGSEKNEDIEEDLEVSWRAARDEVVERDDGVEELEPDEGERFWRRAMLGR